jgi:hypothetical protein
MSKTFYIIMAHADARPTVLRHLPYWRHNAGTGPILLFFPIDATLNVDGCEHLAYGRRGHHGPESIQRFRFLLKHLVSRASAYDRVIIHEYDSICISPRFPETPENVVCANAFFNRDQDPRFTEKMYTHPPLVIPLPFLQRIVDVMASVPIEVGGYFWDRHFGSLCDRVGIEIVSFCEHTKQGYSKNTIEPEHWPSFKMAVQSGARVFHGIKTPEALNVLRASPWVLHTTGGKDNFIAFSLFGTAEKYFCGMDRNIALAEEHFPEWLVRIYMPDEMCGSEWHKRFEPYVKFNPSGIPPMFARFLIHDSPDCDRFIIRDADSRLSQREVDAVNAWITSGRLLHTMRDHPAHTSFPICGGMWGGQGGKLLGGRSMEHAIRNWIKTRAGAYAGHDPDQKFLADVIYPANKDSMLQHDSFSAKYYAGSKPFPTARPEPKPNEPYFVGEVFDENDQCRQGDRDMILGAEGKLPKPRVPKFGEVWSHDGEPFVVIPANLASDWSKWTFVADNEQAWKEAVTDAVFKEIE